MCKLSIILHIYAQAVEEYTAFYKKNFITVFTEVLHWPFF
jgi:hypothetical protein